MDLVASRYQAARQFDGSWSVIDTFTEAAAVVLRTSMVGLEEDTAQKLADLLNSTPQLASGPTFH